MNKLQMNKVIKGLSGTYEWSLSDFITKEDHEKQEDKRMICFYNTSVDNIYNTPTYIVREKKCYSRLKNKSSVYLEY